MLRLQEMRDRYVNSYLTQHHATWETSTSASSSSSSHNEIPVQRFKLVTRLYFRVLHALLIQVSFTDKIVENNDLKLCSL